MLLTPGIGLADLEADTSLSHDGPCHQNKAIYRGESGSADALATVVLWKGDTIYHVQS